MTGLYPLPMHYASLPSGSVTRRRTRAVHVPRRSTLRILLLVLALVAVGGWAWARHLFGKVEWLAHGGPPLAGSQGRWRLVDAPSRYYQRPAAGGEPRFFAQQLVDTHELVAGLRVGCFEDTFEARDLPHQETSYFAAFPAQCVSACGARGFAYAGLQAGNECWCGDTFGRHRRYAGASDAIECSRPCAVYEPWSCGGNLANEVFRARDLGVAKALGLYDAASPPVFAAADDDDVQPPSSVVCIDDAASSLTRRSCRFTNLYMRPDWYAATPGKLTLTFVRSVHSQVYGFPELERLWPAPEGSATTLLPYALELVSVPGIQSASIEVVAALPRGARVAAFPHNETLISSRYLALNIMHTFHDSLLNMAANARLWRVDMATAAVLFADALLTGPLVHLFQALFGGRIMHARDVAAAFAHAPAPAYVRFPSAVVGQTSVHSWYQYGQHGSPQSAIAGKNVSGSALRETYAFIGDGVAQATGAHYAGFQVRSAVRPSSLAAERELSSAAALNPPPPRPTIALVSRLENRRIINEDELVLALRRIFPAYPVTVLRFEETPLSAMLGVVRRSVMLLGMHGSGFILMGWLPPGALVVELFPYAVPPQLATPSRTQANLPGMGLSYLTWQNTHANNTRTFPERSALKGGIKHLPLAEQNKVRDTVPIAEFLCCDNPYWLYRIYQDTIVDTDEVARLIEESGWKPPI